MGSPRALAWSGIAGGIFFTAGTIMVSSVPGGGSATTLKDFQDFYDSSGKRAVPLVGTFVLAIGGVLVLWFLTALSRRIRSAHDGIVAELGVRVGTVGVAAALVGGALLAAPSGVQTFGDLDFVGRPIAIAFAEAGFGALLLVGFVALGLAVIMLSAAARGTGALRGWVAIFGMVAGVIMLGAFVFLPLFAFPIWLLIVGFTSLKAPAAA